MQQLPQKLAALGLGLTLAVTPAMAKHKHDGHHGPRTFTAQARVLKAHPITERVAHKRPYEVCEPVRHRPWRDGHRHHSDYDGDRVGPAVLGAVVGGVIGHQFGSGRGNDAATVAGAAIGAKVGYEQAKHRRGHHDHDRHRPRRECRTEYETYHTTETVGYRVKYRYDGQVYRTRTKRHPGKWLDLQVSLRPIER